MALILVVDSDAILSSALQQAFQRQGPQMVVASHALQAESLTGRYSTGRLNRDLEDNRFVTSHPEVATDKERRWYDMLFSAIWSWLRRKEGQDLTEYALIIGLIVILAVGAITLMGTSIQGILSTIASALNGALGTT
jgi:Flp pilus assembly pilin Flp